MPAQRQTDIAVIEARLLTAQGRRQAAMQLLLSVGENNLSPAGVDLLARLSLEFGQIEKSRALWNRALWMDPSCKAAFDALVILDTPWILYGIAMRLFRLVGVAGIIVLVALGVRSLFLPAEVNDGKPAVEQPLNGSVQNNTGENKQ